MPRSRRKPPRHWILGILLIAVSALTLLSLTGPGWGSMTGPFGRFWVGFWTGLFGIPGVALFSAAGIIWGALLLSRTERRFFPGLTLTLPPFIVAWDGFRHAVAPVPVESLSHGKLAILLHDGVIIFFGPEAPLQHALALGVLALTLSIVLLRYGLPVPVGEFVGQLLSGLWHGIGSIFAWFGSIGYRLLRFCGRIFARAGLVVNQMVVATSDLVSEKLASQKRERRRRREATARRALEAQEAKQMLEFEAIEPEAVRTVAIEDSAQVQLAGTTIGDEAEAAPTASPVASAEMDPVAGDLDTEPAAVPKRMVKRRPLPKGATFVPPPPPDARAVAPISLLEDPGKCGEDVTDEEIRLNARILKETLSSFDIEGEISDVHPGPVITRYEFTPGVGVTISRIVSRQDDLALAMRAQSIRLLAPIPGKAAVGIEIPNKKPALISFKEIAATRPFLETKDPLALALGKDVAGRPFYTSLDKMPHLLVAGTTGSGKSVCMNTLILSLLMRCTPDKLRILMIDPKMLEFTMYNNIPHLARPVVTDAHEAARALNWLTKEMARRYRVLAGVGVRNIAGYELKRQELALVGYIPEPDQAPLEPMPYIAVFVDELADLMLTNQSEIELPIARLAQMARAVGIHLVLATQRPSVDVITGVIKANFPARIAFQVASRTDSRTILDMNGAESLLGRGDMLFIPPGKAQAHRIHGAFLADKEIERVVSYLQQFPEVDPLMGTELEEENQLGLLGDQEDSLFHEAMKIVVGGQQGSTSMLQRRLRIGYTRAGRLMDMLESSGIVGPPDGSRAREVLVPPEYLSEEMTASAGNTNR